MTKPFSYFGIPARRNSSLTGSKARVSVCSASNYVWGAVPILSTWETVVLPVEPTDIEKDAGNQEVPGTVDSTVPGTWCFTTSFALRPGGIMLSDGPVPGKRRPGVGVVSWFEGC